jgi:hypothetical protein
MMEPPIKRPFSALNGAELRKVILENHEKELAGDPKLEQHLTFPIIECETVTTLRYYPGPEEPIKFTSRAKIRARGAEAIPIPDDPGQVDVVESKFSVDAENPPDKVRAEHGLEVPEPRITSQGVVDTGADFA